MSKLHTAIAIQHGCMKEVTAAKEAGLCLGGKEGFKGVSLEIGLGEWIGFTVWGKTFQVEPLAERQQWETTQQLRGTVSIFWLAQRLPRKRTKDWLGSWGQIAKLSLARLVSSDLTP